MDPIDPEDLRHAYRWGAMVALLAQPAGGNCARVLYWDPTHKRYMLDPALMAAVRDAADQMAELMTGQDAPPSPKEGDGDAHGRVPPPEAPPAGAGAEGEHD